MSTKNIIMATLSTPSALGWIALLSKTSTDIEGKSITVGTTGDIYSVIYKNTNPVGATLVKHNSSGAIQWQSTLPSSQINKIVSDSNNNIYLIGLDWTDNRSVLFKYNSSGTLQWQISLISPAGSTAGISITIGYQNTIYVCGTAAGSGFVARYNPDNGDLIWKRAISDSFGNLSNGAITVNANSYQVYVTFTAASDYMVVHRYTEQGTLVWQITYQSTSAKPVGIVTDTSGNNCYVISSFNSTTNASVIFKFDNAGTLQWQKKLQASGTVGYAQYLNSIFLDSSDNLYVITSAAAEPTYLIYKIDSAGTNTLTRQLDIAAKDDKAADIFVDTSYIYMIGTSRLSPNTNALMAKLPKDGTGAGTYTVGSTSVVYSTVANSTFQNATVSLRTPTSLQTVTAGNLAFSKTVITSTNRFAVIEVDSSDNIYTATEGGLLSKYNKNGVLIWSCGSAAIKRCFNIDIASDGSIYMAGHDSTSTSFLAVSKFNANGNEVWSKYMGTTSVSRTKSGIKVSSDGNNLFVFSTVPGGTAFLKLDLNGAIVWQKFINSVSTLAMDRRGSGELLLVGQNTASPGKAVILEIDGSGSTGYTVNRYRSIGIGAASDINRVLSVKFFDDSSIYITGTFSENTTTRGYICKLDYFLARVWAYQYTTTSAASYMNDITCDSSGNVYAVGHEQTSPSKFSVYKFDSNGTLLTSVCINQATYILESKLIRVVNNTLKLVFNHSAYGNILWKISDILFNTGNTIKAGAVTYTTSAASGLSTMINSPVYLTNPTTGTLSYTVVTLTPNSAGSFNFLGTSAYLEGVPLEASTSTITPTAETLTTTVQTI